jgi:hypothetical protein
MGYEHRRGYYPARLQATNGEPASPWRQRLKWVVYAVLFADFLAYFYQDVSYAPFTLDANSGVLEVLRAYVTTIDLVAWFTLILLFELETGAFAGRDWKGPAKWVVRGLRLVCVVAILHTSFSNEIVLREFYVPKPLPPSADVCGYANDWSFLRNRDFIEIDAENCRTIGQGPAFFALSDDQVLTDRAGLREGKILAWTDTIESVAWLLIVLATEAIVRLKQAAFNSVALVAGLGRLKIALYALIVAIAFYWGSKGQFLYCWDEIVWVLGFRMIDWNIRDWRGPRGLFSASRSAA